MTKCTYKDVVPYSTVERPFPVHSRLCGWSPSSEPSRAVLLLDVMYTTDPHHRSRFPTLWAAPFHLFLHGAHALFVCCHPSLPETTSLELPRLVEPYRLTVIYTRENSKEVHSGKVLLFWCALYTRTHSQTLLQCHTLSQKSDFWWRSHSLKTSPLYTFPPTSTAVLRGCVRIWLTKKFAYVHTFWV